MSWLSEHARWLLSIGFGCYLLYGLFHWFWHYPLKSVRVYGAYQYIDRTIVEQVVSATWSDTPNFWGFTLADIQAALQALPWIKQAQVTRYRLGILDVALSERQPVARWGSDALIDAQGELFTPEIVPRQAHQWPLLLGSPEEQPFIWKYYQQFSGILRPISVRISIIRFNRLRAWQLTLSTGTEVWLPREQAEASLRRFVSVYAMVLGDQAQRAKRIDLRYPHGMAVTWDHGYKQPVDRDVKRD